MTSRSLANRLTIRLPPQPNTNTLVFSLVEARMNPAVTQTLNLEPFFIPYANI